MSGAERCRRKFLRIFPDGFQDEDYLGLERNYKVAAHKQWQARLNRETFGSLIEQKAFTEIGAAAIGIEGRTHLIFSFEKMALRDGLRLVDGAKTFAQGLFDLLHGKGGLEVRFERWCEAIAALPRKQSRVLTWPVVTVFGFIAQPHRHFYFKPTVTRTAAQAYGYDLSYSSKPAWKTYADVLGFANRVMDDLGDLKPRDMIDIQSFLWVQGSDEY